MRKIKQNIMNLKAYFKPLKMDFVFDSIYEGHTKADVYIEEIENDKLFIVSEGHGYYFGGETNNIASYTKVVKYFKDEILTRELKSNLGIAKIYYINEAWKKVLLDTLKELKPNIYPRKLFEHTLDQVKKVDVKDENLKIVEINSELLRSTYYNLRYLTDEIKYMWDDFLLFEKNGFGYCAIKDNKIVGWCTAEYMSKNQCGIGIETIEEYQKQGIGFLLANHMVNKCMHVNIIPHWDSWTNNVPSVRVAEKNGFNLINEYNIIFLDFSE